jgi:hypothetical protein
VISGNDADNETLTPFCAKTSKKVSPCIQFNETHIYDFAIRAKSLLHERLSDKFLPNPFLRVDIFETQCGNIVVNEFESLEAMIDASGKTICGWNKDISEYRFECATISRKFLARKFV